MSSIHLQTAKKYLDVIHDYDDDKLQLLLEAAEDEALQFMDRPNLTCWYEPTSEPVSEQAMPVSVQLGILILLQAAYQASPDEAQQLRNVAEVKLMPYRCNLGV